MFKLHAFGLLAVALICFLATSSVKDNSPKQTRVAQDRQVYMGADMPGTVERLKTGAENGDVDALYYLGLLYDSGIGLPKDHGQAASCYQRAALGGQVEAMYNLAVAYEDGRGLAHDQAQAVYWYGKAAENGNKEAMFNLAICYNEGKGVERDYGKTLYWYAKIGNNGSDDVIFNMLLVHDENQGVPASPIKIGPKPRYFWL